MGKRKKRNLLHYGNKAFGGCFAYFIIYSIVGFIIETIFGFITKGVIESRQKFLIWSILWNLRLGAVIMIDSYYKYFKKNNYTLFLEGL